MAQSTSSSDGAKVKLVDLSVTQMIRGKLAASPEAGALIGFFAVFIFFALSTDTFFKSPTIANMLTNQSVLGIVAVGITFLMISGEFDLSVGSILGVSGIVFGQFLIGETFLGLPPVGIGIAFIAAIATGALLGLVNGLILVWTRIPSFIVTLGTLLFYRSLALAATTETGILRHVGDDPTVTASPIILILILLVLIAFFGFLAFLLVTSSINNWREKKHIVDRVVNIVGLVLGGGFLAFIFLILGDMTLDLTRNMSEPVVLNVFDLMNGRMEFMGELGFQGNFRTVTIWFLAVVGIFTFILGQTRYGNATFATGGAGEAARAQGIAVDRVRIINFVLCGTTAALAATLEFARQSSASGDRGTGWELEAIAAAVIGGTLLSGGYGSVVGTLIGVLLAGMLRTGLVQLGLPAELFRGVIGVIIIIAVIINTLVRRQR